MAETIYTGITVQGLYSDQTGDQLFGVVGSPVPASVVYVGGKDNNGNLQPLSIGSNGYLNVNASITPPSDNVNSGTLNTTPQTIAVSTEGTSALMVQLVIGLNGLASGDTINFQVSLDGSTWQNADLIPVPEIGAQESNPFVSSVSGPLSNVTLNYTLPVGGIQQFQVSTSGTWTASTVGVTETAGQGQYGVFNYSLNQANFLATTYQGGAWSVGVTGTVATNLTEVGGTAVSLGQKTSAASFPVVIASDQSAIPVSQSGSWTVAVSGTVAVTQSTSPWVVAGNLTHNSAAPAADNVGVLPALANAAAPTFTEGDQVLLSTDLAGNLRTTATFSGTVSVAGSLTNNNAAPAANNLGVLGFVAETAYNTVTYTTGNQVLAVTDLHGAVNADLQAVAGVQLGSTAVTAFGTAPAAAAVQGVNASIYAGTTGVTATGSSLNVNITGSSGNTTVVGTLTNNNAAPSTTNVGVLPAVAVSATPETYTAGNQVLPTASLGGSTVTIPADQQYQSSIGYFSADNNNIYKTISSNILTPTACISIRPNSATVNYTILGWQGFTSGTVVRFHVLKNATLSGASFAATGGTMQVDTAGTYSSGGTVVYSGYAGTVPYLDLDLKQYVTPGTGGTGDTFTIVAVAFGSGTASACGAFKWMETTVAL